MKPLKIVFIFLTYINYCYCYSYNTKHVKVISDFKIKDRYFGYSLLLQKGITPTVIVGAPKAKKIKDNRYGGQVYQCQIETNSFTPLIEDEDQLISYPIPNGDFFGGAIDGEDYSDGGFVACSPRASINASGSEEPHIYSIGACMYTKKHLGNNEPLVQLDVRKFDRFLLNGFDPDARNRDKHYYKYGYGLFGSSVSYLNKDNILVGMPGIKDFNGATAFLSLSSTYLSITKSKYMVPVLPKRSAPDWSASDSYFGYSVDSNIFHSHTTQVWLLAGEPRGNGLKGKATLYLYNRKVSSYMEILHIFNGTKFGSYFGASVLIVDVTNDKQMDILIAAPMTAGKSYDEGAVYFYKTYGVELGSSVKYVPSQKVTLTGPCKMGGRFGTSMVSLGDFDLDGFNDVAISAPNENNGKGAVYIYRGGTNGLRDGYSQRLAPSDFNVGTGARGFGMGMSRGNDIDQNGHNDFAVGAYKTDEVFLIKSHSIVDYTATLKSHIPFLKKTTNTLNMELCLTYAKRSKILNLPHADFRVEMIWDYRARNYLKAAIMRTLLDKQSCKTFQTNIRTDLKDVSSFNVKCEISIATDDIVANGSKSIQQEIPYQLDCGSDNICTTGLTIKLKSKKPSLIYGIDKTWNLEISVENDGELAYVCELWIKVPKGIELRNSRKCIEKNRNYTCAVSDILHTNIKQVNLFVFDVISKDLVLGDLLIEAGVGSIGVNKAGYKAKDVFKFSVIKSSISYIIGNSIPDTMELRKRNDLLGQEVTFEFSVDKLGPAPVAIYVDLLFPNIHHLNETIFNVLSVKGSIDRLALQCRKATQRALKWEDIVTQLKGTEIPINSTVMVHCGDTKTDCVQFSCSGGSLNDDKEIAKFEVKMWIKSKYLVSKFRTELVRKGLIAFIPIAFQKQSIGTDAWNSVTAPFLIFVKDPQYFPLWTYLVIAIVTTGLLILMIVGLNQCSFFDRTYKERLEEEKLLQPPAAVRPKSTRKIKREETVAANDVVRRTRPLPSAPTLEEIADDGEPDKHYYFQY